MSSGALCGPDRPLEMLEVGEVIGRLRAAELSLFRWLGRLAPTLPAAHEAAWASAASLRAAWRATQLEPLLPVSAGLARPEEVAATAEPSGGDRVLDEAGRRYGELAGAYRYRLERLSAAADGAVERCLRRVLGDLEAEATALQRVENRLVGPLDSTVTLTPGHTAVQVRGLNPGGRA